MDRVYLYSGFWFAPAHLNEFFSYWRDDNVILPTMPKSDRTWLKALLFALSLRALGEDSSGQPSPLLTTNTHVREPFLEINLFIDNQNPDLSLFTSPRVFASHIPYTLLPRSIKDSKRKVVYLCRNVKENFTSLWHFSNKLRLKERGQNGLEEAYDKFCRGATSFGPYWDHVLGYWKDSLEMPKKLLFLKYEDMKERPEEIVKRLAEFIGCPFVQGEDEDEAAHEILCMCSFESLSKLEVNNNGKQNSGEEKKFFFRKGDVGDWMNLLISEMANRLVRITEEKMRECGLEL